ncbi:hypothetical protein AcV5_010419 [Taiwanofungus camphoratus]|nr:hypothetical protein AcV5_010419 [Antrodia cinnamomea]
MKSLGKRSPSPLPLSLDIKKPRLQAPDVPKWKASPTPEPIRSNPDRPTCGTEWIRITTNVQRDTESINNIILRTTEGLARLGKRLVHAPKLLPDGICFDWVLDFSAKKEDIERLLVVKGVGTGSLQVALRRRKLSQPYSVHVAANGVRNTPVIDDRSDEGMHSTVYMTAPNRASESGYSAGNPICIDMDGEEPQAIIPSVALTEVSNEGSMIASSRRHSRTPSSNNGSLLPRQEPSAPGHSPRSRNNDLSLSGRSIQEHRCVLSLQEPRESVSIDTLETLQGKGSHSLGTTDCFPLLGTTRVPPTTEPSSRGISASPPSSSAQQARREYVDSLYGDFDMLASSTGGEESDEGNNSYHSPERQRPSLSREQPVSSGCFRQLPTSIPEQSLEKLCPSRPSRFESSTTDGDIAEGDSPFDSQRATSSSSSTERLTTERSRQFWRSSVQPSKRGICYRPRAEPQSSQSNHDSSDEDSSIGTELSAPCFTKRRDPPQPSENDNIHNNRDRILDSSVGREVIIPKTDYARGRRLLAPSDAAIPYATIAMRRDAQFISRSLLVRISRYSLPLHNLTGAPDPHVEDACLLEDHTAIVGYDSGPCQVSVIALDVDQPPRRMDLSHKAHSTVQESRTTGIAHPNPGISALAPVEGAGLRFLSGGHDKTLQIWTLKQSIGKYIARSQRLKIIHSQRVQAIAYRAHDQSVFSCAGTHISTMQLSAHVVPDPIRVSDGRILQIHVHPQAPNLVILEVDQIDRQIQIYDTRRAGFHQAPCLEFGSREASTKPVTRYVKGSALLSLFARPYANDNKGVVRVWDYRKASNVMTRFHSLRPAPVVHAVLSGVDVIAYGAHSVTFWDLNSNDS